MTRQRTVLYVERNVDGTIGGSYRSLLYLVRLLPKDRWRPVVAFYRDHHLIEEYKRAGCKVLLLEYPRSRNLVAQIGWLAKVPPIRAGVLLIQKAVNLLVGSLALVASHSRLLRDERVDLVHLNNGVMSGTELLVASRLRGIRTVVHQRGIGPLPPVFRTVRHLIDHVIAVSDAARDHLVSHGLSAARCTTIHNGIEPDEFRATVRRSATDVRASLGIPADALVIGNSGMIKVWKGQMVLVQAMARLRDRHPNAYCLIVGGTSDSFDGDAIYLKQMQEFVASHGLTERVKFAGYQQLVAEFIQVFDIMVHTSIDPEPFSRSVLEGMTMGRPMVASRTGGTPEAIEHGVTGLLVEPGDVDGLAAELDVLIRDGALRSTLGDRARRRIDQRFSIRTNVEATQRVYATVFGEHAGPRGAAVPASVHARGERDE